MLIVGFISASIFLTPSEVSQAALKIPVVDITKSVLIQDATDFLGMTRFNEGWLVAGTGAQGKSWIASLNQRGEESWRISPIDLGLGGDGFITAIAADSLGATVAGISQSELSVISNLTPTPSPTPSTTVTATPAASPSKNLPLVNPDNVVIRDEQPFRKDLSNIFIARIDVSGVVTKFINTQNPAGFVPSSIVVSSKDYFLVGNESVGESSTRGALYKFDNQGLVSSYSFGKTKTSFNKAIANSSKYITIVGSSGESVANRKVVGQADGIILSVSTATGKVNRILRSSGVGAIRSWEFASGNLLVSGTSQTKSLRESVITSFTVKGAVGWTTRFQKSDFALADQNCVAVSLLGASVGLPFNPKTPEIFLYMVDGKGKIQRGARFPNQGLVSLVATPAKGCAMITYSNSAGTRMSYLQ